MPVLKIKKACNDCPWRLKAMPGWLGASYPEKFLEQTLAMQMQGPDGAMPCHQTIDYSDPDWLTTQLPGAAMCAGSLRFLSNLCIGMHDPIMAAAVQAVGPGDDVFSRYHTFLQHHYSLTRPELPEGHWMFIGPNVLVDHCGAYRSHRDVPGLAPEGRRAA